VTRAYHASLARGLTGLPARRSAERPIAPARRRVHCDRRSLARIERRPARLDSHLFHFVGEPNRYGLPAFYELHVWAWRRNPSGTFADFNPVVSCDAQAAD